MYSQANHGHRVSVMHSPMSFRSFDLAWVLIASLCLHTARALHAQRDGVDLKYGVRQQFNVDSHGHLQNHALDEEAATIDRQHDLSEQVAGMMRREKKSDTLTQFQSDVRYAMSVNPSVSHKNVSGSMLQVIPLSVGGLQCGTASFAPADPCPRECEYLAEDPAYICHFRCVPADGCGSLDPLARIADDELKICRRCTIQGCATCQGGTTDVCLECKVGYSMGDDGKCYGTFQVIMFVLKIVVLLIFVILALWFLELVTRRKTNWRGLKHGLAFRWRTRIHMPETTPAEEGVDDTGDAAEEAPKFLVYPLTTNLLRQPVGGPGTCLHFNFEVVVMIWAVVMCYVYAMVSCMISTDMMIIGLWPAKTSQQLCAVVHWGHDAQMRDMWARSLFIIFAYLFTFLGSLAFGKYQYHDFERLDDVYTSMKDYAMFVKGLPILKGSENVELKLKECVQKATKQKVVGASICWNYTEKFEEVQLAIEADWKEREALLAPPQDESASADDADAPPPRRQPKLGCFRRNLRKIDCVFGFDPPGKHDAPTLEPSNDTTPTPSTPLVTEESSTVGSAKKAPTAEEITKILNDMESANVAFIVFETEQARNDAFDYVKDAGGIDFEGSTLQFEIKLCEPGSARFAGLAYGTGAAHRAKKVINGCWTVAAALLLWSVCFYLPYAFYIASFSYAHGDAPPFFAMYFFVMLVVAGNQAMYFLADMISQKADFMFEDDREVAYNIIYVLACVFNLFCDLIITVFLAYRQMVAMGVHTADGRLIADLGSFEEVFEAYPVQKALGEALWLYCFPSCFLFPFILEGIGTITLPYYVAKAIVLSHDEVQDRDAELSMQYFLPMNLGRYGDIILNMILAVFVFFCPGGYTIPMFLALLLSHAYIYAYDHYRVLRCTPNFCFASDEVDRFGQALLIMPTAVLAAAAMFRCCQWWDLNGVIGMILCLLAFFGHCALHGACLKFLLPLTKPKDHTTSGILYADCAKSYALNWFTANPVHCLRSKYIFKHSPPAIATIYGKEHLVKANPEIGVYFDKPEWGQAHTQAKVVDGERKLEEVEDKAEKEDTP
jgi:hypothetical protein